MRVFEPLDKNRDGFLSSREFHLEDDEWRSLDADGDGAVRLVEPHPFQRVRGFAAPGSEWQSLRPDLILLPPGISVEALLAEFDRNGDETLDARELKAREDLLLALDPNGDRRVDRDEVVRRLTRLEEEGVAALPDDFLGRWDLDGSGTVEPDELPGAVRARLGLR